jgi:hypothetical protein
VNRKYQRRLNSEHQRHLKALRLGEADTAEQVAKSREAIENSLALLQRDGIEGAQKPETPPRHSEARGVDRAAPKKTRPRRSGARTATGGGARGIKRGG